MDTGFPSHDAQTDFSRALRRRQLARIAARLRREPDDVSTMLPFDEVVEALGRRGERRLGLETIDLDSIVGSVDRTREFDRSFRPRSRSVRRRWQRIAEATRRGESMAPIEVYRVGELHFVVDGHHRVSVARHQGLDKIDAYVTAIETELSADPAIAPRDLPVKGHERLFFERVPLPRAERGRIRLTAGSDWGRLAESVEAWGLRLMQARRELLTREEVAEAWFREEYEPVVEMLREAGLCEPGGETETYLRVISRRYELLRTHEWSDDVIERLRREL